MHYKKGDRAVARLSSEPSSSVFLSVAVGVYWGKFSQAVHLGWTAKCASGNVPNLSRSCVSWARGGPLWNSIGLLVLGLREREA